MFRKLACWVFILVPFMGTSQDSAVYSLGADFNYHPQSFFFHVRAQRAKKHVSHDVFFGFGINSTVFQSQFRPHIGYDLGCRFRLTDWFAIAPVLRLSYMLLNTEVPEKHPWIHTTESFAACRLIFGKKHRLALSGGIGPAVEWKYDAYQERRNHFFTWNYFTEIGYYYVL